MTRTIGNISPNMRVWIILCIAVIVVLVVLGAIGFGLETKCPKPDMVCYRYENGFLGSINEVRVDCDSPNGWDYRKEECTSQIIVPIER